MIDVAEWVAARIYALQLTTWQQWLLRGVLLAAGLGAALLASAWVSPVVLPPWWVLVVPLLGGAVLWPDSWAPLLVVTAIAVAWLGGGDASWWRQLAVVALAALFHLAAAYAAAAPTFAVVRGAVARRMVVAAVAFVAASAVVAAGLLGWSHG